MVLILGIVKASLEILGIGIGVKKVVLLMSDPQAASLLFLCTFRWWLKIEDLISWLTTRSRPGGSCVYKASFRASIQVRVSQRWQIWRKGVKMQGLDQKCHT